MNVSIIILAAGESARLGQPKQLLKYNNKTLLEHTIVQAKDSLATQIIVVLGAFSERIKSFITPYSVDIIINENWKNGMSSSLQKGLKLVPKGNAILVLLSDQPFVNTALFNKMITKSNQTPHSIIATQYDDTLGVPALFKPLVFPSIKALKATQGAKKVILSAAKQNQVEAVSFPKGKIDIDTIEDYKQLIVL